MLSIDLSGKRALVAGVSDDAGFGFAIAKALAEAGASVCLGSWPPALGIFTKLLERGKIEESLRLADGRRLEFERIYPLDAAFDTMAEVPESMGWTSWCTASPTRPRCARRWWTPLARVISPR